MSGLGLGLLLATLQACGYQYSENRNLPGDVQTIAIDVLSNRARQSGLEVTVTNALVTEFTSRRQAMVVDTDRAQAVLSGSIRLVTTDVVTRSSTRQVRVRQVNIVVALVLKDKNGNMLWRNDRLAASESYAVSDDEIVSEANRRAALDRAVRRLAEYAYLQIVQGF